MTHWIQRCGVRSALTALLFVCFALVGCAGRSSLPDNSRDPIDIAAREFFQRQGSDRLDLAAIRPVTDDDDIPSAVGSWVQNPSGDETRQFLAPARQGGNPFVYTLTFRQDSSGRWVVTEYHIDRVALPPR